jgi:hypothetical protein
MTPELKQQIIDALETAVDNARNLAEDAHESYRGYYPELHAAVDRDVAEAEAALAAIQKETP